MKSSAPHDSRLHLLGIRHVERNGHHYFRGLQMLGEAVNTATLSHHGDLYTRHSDGFATLALRDGRIAVSSVIGAPFGTAFRIDECLSPWLPLDEWRQQGAFAGF